MNQTYQSILARIKSNPLLYRLAHGSFWSLAGTIASRAFTLVSTIFVARILGVADYGAYGMILSTLEMFGLFAGLSLGLTSSKYVAEYKHSDPKRAGRILSFTHTVTVLTGAMMGLAMFLSAPWLANNVLNRADLASILSIGAGYLAVSTINNAQSGALSGFEAFRTSAKIAAIQGAVTPVVVIPSVYYWGLHGAVVSMIILSMIGYALCAHEVNKLGDQFNISFSRFDLTSFSERAVLWNFSIPALASGLLVVPVTWITNTILVNLHNGYHEMGLFNAANQWRQLIIFIPQILSSVMLPILSEAHGKDDKDHFNRALKINLKLTWMIALPMTVFIIGIREQISALFGKNYSGMEILINVLMITSFLNIVNGVIGTALAGAGKMWLGAAMNLGWAAALILFTVLLAPDYGGLGLSLAYLISYALHTCWVMLYTDTRLARHTLRNQGQLILITALTIVPILVLTLLNKLNNATTIMLFVLSLIPLYGLFKTEFHKSAV